MARAPSGPRLIKGVWWAVRTVDGHKYSKSLGSNEAQARRLWPDAFASLGPEKPRKYHPLELVTYEEWDPETGVRSEQIEQAQYVFNASELTEDPHGNQPLTVKDAWDNAEEIAARRRLRRSKQPVSESWRKQIKAVRKFLPHGVLPEHLTPGHIRTMMTQMELAGHADSTISTRVAALSGLLSALSKSGLVDDLINAASRVDYSSKPANHHRTASEEEYKLMLNSVLKDDPILQRLIYCGVRIGEAINGRVEGNTFVIEPNAETGWRPKNKSSHRVIPLPFPMEQGEIVSAVSFRKRFNKVRDRSDLTPHSFRHGYMQLSRQVGAEPLATEAIMGHALPSMLEIYGGGYDVSTMRREMEKVWSLLSSWLKHS